MGSKYRPPYPQLERNSTGLHPWRKKKVHQQFGIILQQMPFDHRSLTAHQSFAWDSTLILLQFAHLRYIKKALHKKSTLLTNTTKGSGDSII